MSISGLPKLEVSRCDWPGPHNIYNIVVPLFFSSEKHLRLTPDAYSASELADCGDRLKARIDKAIAQALQEDTRLSARRSTLLKSK